MVLETAPELVFDGADLMDAFDEMQKRSSATGGATACRSIPPTHRKVEAMIAASGRDGERGGRALRARASASAPCARSPPTR